MIKENIYYLIKISDLQFRFKLNMSKDSADFLGQRQSAGAENTAAEQVELSSGGVNHSSSSLFHDDCSGCNVPGMNTVLYIRIYRTLSNVDHVNSGRTKGAVAEKRKN